MLLLDIDSRKEPVEFVASLAAKDKAGADMLHSWDLYQNVIGEYQEKRGR